MPTFRVNSGFIRLHAYRPSIWRLRRTKFTILRIRRSDEKDEHPSHRWRCSCSVPRRTFRRRRRRCWRWNVRRGSSLPRGNVQRGIVTKPLETPRRRWCSVMSAASLTPCCRWRVKFPTECATKDFLNQSICDEDIMDRRKVSFLTHCLYRCHLITDEPQGLMFYI